MDRIFSPGKLLLTSEYLVLDGALALAVATKLGQEFYYEKVDDFSGNIFWEAYHQNQIWLKAIINTQNWEIVETNLPTETNTLLNILRYGYQMSTLSTSNAYSIRTNLQFPSDFGLGSSATLINNIATFFDCNAFELNQKIFGGSGYDIAVAKEKSALLYQLKNDNRNVQKIEFCPVYSKDLVFIHLNRKKNSREGLQHFKNLEKNLEIISECTTITHQVVHCKSIEEFSELMQHHENILSDFLKTETCGKTFFRNCPVFTKSLGAWGGDFVMSRKFDGYLDWFSERGFKTIISWDDLII